MVEEGRVELVAAVREEAGAEDFLFPPPPPPSREFVDARRGFTLRTLLSGEEENKGEDGMVEDNTEEEDRSPVLECGWWRVCLRGVFFLCLRFFFFFRRPFVEDGRLLRRLPFLDPPRLPFRLPGLPCRVEALLSDSSDSLSLSDDDDSDEDGGVALVRSLSFALEADAEVGLEGG